MIKSQQVQLSSKALYLITFTLLLFVLPTSFIHEKTARVIFYWCGYLSVIGLLINAFITKQALNEKKIPFVFLLLTCLFLGWSTISKYYSGDTSSELLFTPGKRWLVAAVIALYILNIKVNFKSILNSKAILYVMSLAFICSSAFGIIQGLISDERIFLGINRATLTAYAYSAFTLAFSSIIAFEIKNKYKYLIQSLILIVSTYVIFLTQTRAAMFIHPMLGLLLLIAWMYKDKVLSLNVLIICFISLIVVMAANSNIIAKRYDSTMRDINEYSRGNDNTSLGARFSMWKLGLIAFQEAPLGQSESHRNIAITDYLKDNKEKSAATQYLKIHLHNEFIQYASLFGIFGVIALLAFFFILIFKVSQPSIIGPIGVSTISIALYGATDVLLTSIELIVVFSTTIILSSIASNFNQKGM
ncbi:O-antigen ligase family protein [Enterobacter cloacae subsp. cloacae]|uniref:O-antigen ligase family protein n=1 Tax=Enterobacter TaxID=547 RepID=UPI0006823661|nr:O-antigen ligase family protein [Enterobacter cloacae]HCM9252280.1 O-antigen ligase family protein [Enterobacter cloacae subsp. dissolvens]ELR9129862.1 O-antigen ligase family protein [Enterobacter cloacae]MBW4200706.1 O-antigen ligase family protein [Enterobacter cloacae subsp. cloacae]PCM80650.1 O-antigen ligase [Enterobacter cloacae]HDT0660935.1 O-antigen ligase family protein [Enterobacter cloacae subsp. dissolvens]